MKSFYHFEIITPTGVVYQEEVEHIELPAEDGYTGVLANHAPYITSSPGGRLTIRETKGDSKRFLTGPGLFEVLHNKARLLTQSLEIPLLQN